MHSTTALSGGFRYRPTTSMSFCSNRLSSESLNVSTRCGCRPLADQIRCTVAGLPPSAFAIHRQLQCVSPCGFLVQRPFHDGLHCPRRDRPLTAAPFPPLPPLRKPPPRQPRPPR